jgi:hypothetical protein
MFNREQDAIKDLVKDEMDDPECEGYLGGTLLELLKSKVSRT